MESSHTVFLYPWPQEAAELSSLKPQLDELGVPLYAVVKEDVGTEVQNFRPYFKGEIFLDKKVPFFLPHNWKLVWFALKLKANFVKTSFVLCHFTLCTYQSYL